MARAANRNLARNNDAPEIAPELSLGGEGGLSRVLELLDAISVDDADQDADARVTGPVADADQNSVGHDLAEATSSDDGCAKQNRQKLIHDLAARYRGRGGEAPKSVDIPKFAPGCFGSSLIYKDDHAICRACPLAAECKPLHQKNRELLERMLGPLDTYEQRQTNDYQRERYHKKAQAEGRETRRNKGYTDLSQMTGKQKVAHKRDLQKVRKQEQRQRDRDRIASEIADVLQELEDPGSTTADELADELNSRGMVTAKGRPWTAKALKKPRSEAMKILQKRREQHYSNNPNFGRF